MKGIKSNNLNDGKLKNFNNMYFKIMHFFIYLIDISSLGFFYLLGGLFFSIIIEKLSQLIDTTFGDYHNRATSYLILEIILYTSIIMISAFILRNILSNTPFIFNGLFGYKRGQQELPELRGGIMITFAVLLFTNIYQRKIHHVVINRLHLLKSKI